MKTIGLIGEMSWQSTRTHYDLLNEMVTARLGGLHSAEILMRSIDFARLEAAMRRGDWTAIESHLGDEVAALEQGCAGCVLLCSNTIHKQYSRIATRVGSSFFHIADALGHALAVDGLTCVGLLGKRFNMVKNFYATRLREGFGIDVILAHGGQIGRIDAVIFDELRRGIVEDSSHDSYLEIMDGLAAHGAEDIILGRTEIEMLVKPEHHVLPLYDTTLLHACHAVEWALLGD